MPVTEQSTPALSATLVEPDVAEFAAKLKEENDKRVTDDTEEIEQPTETTRSVEPSADVAAIRAAFDAGDVAKLAELLGADPKSTKVTKSQWAEYRIKTRDARRELDTQRATLEQERAALTAEKEGASKLTEAFTQAREAAANEDYERAIELLTGKQIGEVIDAMAADMQNPTAREVRKLRRESEQQRAKLEEERKQLEQQQLTQRQQIARAQYVAELKSTIAADTAAKPLLDEYGQEFVGLVFAEIEAKWKQGQEITEAQAIKTVLRHQLSAYDRGKQIFEGLREALGQSGSGKPSEQGNRGARLSPRKPSTNSQGGAKPAQPMSEQEEIAHWARQLRAENAQRKSV